MGLFHGLFRFVGLYTEDSSSSRALDLKVQSI